jgi:hypothetical protein
VSRHAAALVGNQSAKTEADLFDIQTEEVGGTIAALATPGRAGKTPGDALEIGKHAVASLHGNAERGCIDVRDIFRVVRVSIFSTVSAQSCRSYAIAYGG